MRKIIALFFFLSIPCLAFGGSPDYFPPPSPPQPAGAGDASTASPLSQFASTTSLQLLGVISDETGTGALVFATSPTLVTPALGTPSSGDISNTTGNPSLDGSNFDLSTPPAIGGTTPAAGTFSTMTATTFTDGTCQSTGGTLSGCGGAISQWTNGGVYVTTAGLGAGFDTEAEQKANGMVVEDIATDDAGTITPTAGYGFIVTHWAPASNPSAVTLGETGALTGAIWVLENDGANTGTIDYAANNFENNCGSGTTTTLAPNNSITMIYDGNGWVVIVDNTNSPCFASIQVPVKSMDPVVDDPDNVTFTTAGTNLYGQRFIATATGTYGHSGVVASGENWAIESQTATAIAVTVNASDTYYLNGVSCTQGVGLTSDSSVDAFVACQYQAANTVTCRGTSFTCTP